MKAECRLDHSVYLLFPAPKGRDSRAIIDLVYETNQNMKTITLVS